MRIVYGIPGSAIGGGVNVVLEHASRLMRRGHDVIVLNLLGELDTTWNPNFRYTSLSVFRADHMLYLRSLKLDLVICTGWQTVYEVARLNLSAKSFVYFLQADEAEFNPRGSLDFELAVATRSLAFNYITCASWLSRLALNEEAVPIVNGLNHDIFKPQDPLVPKGKKLRFLIEGPLSQPRKRIPDAFLCCAPYRKEIEVWCVSSGGQLQEWFKPDLYFERVPMLSMAQIYSSCDIILKLSSAEGMFGPPLEMMACGGTAITSNCDGHEEYMVHGENGLVVDVGDIEAGQGCVASLINDRQMVRTLQSRASRTAARFQWEPVIDRLEAAFKEFTRDRTIVTMRSFFQVRGTPLSPSLLKLYKDKSYGSLPRPTALSRGHRAICFGEGKGLSTVVRLRGWVDDTIMEKRHMCLKVSGPNIVPEIFYEPSIDRPDVRSPDSARLNGFDILVPLNDKPSVETTQLRMSGVTRQRSEDDWKLVGHLTNVLPHVPVQFIVESEDLYLHGALEEADLFQFVSLEPVGLEALNRQISLTVNCTLTKEEGYIFYQKKSIRTFLNHGLRVPENPGLQHIKLIIDHDPDDDGSLLLICSQSLELDSISIEV